MSYHVSIHSRSDRRVGNARQSGGRRGRYRSRRLFSSLARRWLRIAVVALLVTVAALGLAWLATPLYKGETRLLIEARELVSPAPSRMSTPTARCSTRKG